MKAKTRVKPPREGPAPAPPPAAGPWPSAWPLWLSLTTIWALCVFKAYLPLHPASFGILGALVPPDLGFLVEGAFWARVLYYALRLAECLFLLWEATGIGLALFDLLGWPRMERPRETRILACGLGLGAASQGLFLLAAVHAFYPAVLTACVSLAAFPAYWFGWRRAGAPPAPSVPVLPRLSWEARLSLALLAPLAVLTVVMGLIPEVFYDSLVYHLSVPRFYLLHHGFALMRFLSHSDFPLGMELLYAPCLVVGDGVLAKLLHGSLALLTLALAYEFCARFASGDDGVEGANAGFCAALALAATPVFAINSWTSGNDVALGFFFACSLYAACLGLREKQRRWLYLSALFSGWTLCVKYTGVYFAAPLGALLAWEILRDGFPGNRVALVAELAGLEFFLFAPWLAKNYVLTGNPVHPFLGSVFGYQTLKHFSGANAVFNNGLAVFSMSPLRMLEALASSPWKRTLEGNSSLNFTGPLFLLAAPLALAFLFFGPKPSPEQPWRPWRFVAANGVLAYIPWYCMVPDSRYYLPAFFGWSVVLGWAFSRSRVWLPKLARPLLFAPFFAACLHNALSFFGIAVWNYQPFNVLVGRQTVDDYLSRTLPGIYPNPPYAVLHWADAHLPPDAKVLFVGENKSYYLDRDFITYSVESNREPVVVLTEESSSPQDLYERLRKLGVTHLLWNVRETMRLQPDYHTFDWSDATAQRFYDFWDRYLTPAAYAEGTFLLRLKGPSETAPPAPPLLRQLAQGGYGYPAYLRALVGDAQWDTAIDEFQYLLSMGAPVQKQLAALYLKTGRKEQAAALYQAALERNPQDAEAAAALKSLTP